jgi:hypothetical protein
MLFDYLLDLMPVMLAFSTPMMPVGNAPVSPSASANAERQRQQADQDARISATAGGAELNVSAGRELAYASQKRQYAGRDLGL